MPDDPKTVRDALEEAKGCFDAAITEDLYERLAATDEEGPGTLSDLINRRLLYAYNSIVSALKRLRSAPPAFKCKAHRGIGGNDPQECDWPVCGCDPYADKVIAALEEMGTFNQPTKKGDEWRDTTDEAGSNCGMKISISSRTV